MRCIYDCQGSGGGQGAIDPHFSPDAKWVAFVRGEEQAAADRESGRARREGRAVMCAGVVVVQGRRCSPCLWRGRGCIS